jgi:hypothetical protein
MKLKILEPSDVRKIVKQETLQLRKEIEKLKKMIKINCK